MHYNITILMHDQPQVVHISIRYRKPTNLTKLETNALLLLKTRKEIIPQPNLSGELQIIGFIHLPEFNNLYIPIPFILHHSSTSLSLNTILEAYQKRITQT